MKPNVTLLCYCFLSLFLCSSLLAQEKNTAKFGKISADDFKTTVYNVDSGAAAVVLVDKGSTSIVGNSKGWFSLEFKHFKRVHILNKNGYDAADIEVSLYSSNDGEEELSGLKAITYNLDGGKVAETKFDKKTVFSDQKSKNWVVKKFTLPNIKEGSIIDLEYTVKSDFLFNLQPWEFQGKYPRLWSEYEVSMPEFLVYVFLTQGYHPYHINDSKNRLAHFDISDNVTSMQRTEHFTIKAGVTDHRWVMVNIPSLKEESFTSTLDNHIAKINFQLSEFRQPLVPKRIMGSWAMATEAMMKDEDFGLALDKDNGWLGDIIKPLIAGKTNDHDKAKAIYEYVRDNFTCTNHYGKYLNQNLKNIVKSKNGNVADINLLLTAMLKYAGLNADPVILSTRSNGYTYSLYPVMDKFNYVVSQVMIDGKPNFLDATHSRLGFGKLVPECYNGHARVVNAQATPLDFTSNSLAERKLTSVFIATNDKGALVGKMNQQPGYFESYRIRDRITRDGKDNYFKELKKSFAGEVEFVDPVVDAMNDLDKGVQVKYDFVLDNDGEEIMYINPLFGNGYKENPFKSEKRLYPVEMPYTLDETYVLNMQVPEGYEVDELPKSMRLMLNEQNEGMFEYLLSHSGPIITMRTRIKIDRTYFLPEEYDMLREFYNMVVNKQSEQIVLKKKANP